MPGTDIEFQNLENTYILNINGETGTLSFDCTNAPSVYQLGVLNDQAKDNFIFDQGY